MKLGNSNIQFEDSAERLKVEIPLNQNKAVAVLYSILAACWLGGLILFILFLFRPSRESFIAGLPRSIQIVWILGVIIWIYVWVRYIGRIVLRWWQFYLAKRELLFISENTIIVRRPVSIFGLTDAYDRRHVSPIYRSEQHSALAFPYGNVQHILFAMTLQRMSRCS